MSNLAIASILEELRCMDGELFKAEICQRVFLWLKTQACESLEPMFQKPQEYIKSIEMYKSWSAEVAKEELLSLQEKSGGAEELNSAWVALSMHWVRLNKKSDGGKSSVKIRNPDPRELLKNFFFTLCSKTWCVKGDLWTMDPVKQDFVFREVFRHSVANSIHFIAEDSASTSHEFLQPEKTKLKSSSIKEEVKSTEMQETQVLEPVKHSKHHYAESLPNLSVKKETEMVQEMEAPKQEKKNVETEEIEYHAQTAHEKVEEDSEQGTKAKTEVQHDTSTKTSSMKNEEPEEKRYEERKPSLPVQTNSEDEEDDIGPDDSVSHFFGASKIEPPKFPEPPRRYADAGTVMYSSAPKRVLVKPITLKLENPLQKVQEE